MKKSRPPILLVLITHLMTLMPRPSLAASPAAEAPPKPATESGQRSTFSHEQAMADYAKEMKSLGAKKGQDTVRLHRLFDLSWKHAAWISPEMATSLGYPGENDRWSEMSIEAINARKQEPKWELDVLKSIDRARLSASDRLNFDLYKRDLDESLEGQRFPGEFLPVSQLSGVQQWPAQLLEMAPHTTVQDYTDQLKRLERLPSLLSQIETLMQEGIRRGVTQAQVTMRDVPEQIKAQMEADATKNPLLLAFQKMPTSISKAEQDRLKNEAQKVLTQTVIPAYAGFYKFFVEQYLPHCRATIGWSTLSDGKAWYDFLAKSSTTTDLTARQIHELGLSEVARIRKEMEELIVSTKFHGDFRKFVKFLQTDSRFYYTDAAQLVSGYRDIAKRIDPELPKLFGKLPRLTYGVEPIPAYADKAAPAAYYDSGSVKAGRAGVFRCNTYDLKSRLKWQMEDLTAHEAVPGHHLQIALAEEMDEAPEFRKHGGYTAYTEGWGLYAESLGYDLGLYKDPYSKFGQLSAEIWRAIRLVVDTGIHHYGWTRQQAIDYFLENSANAEHDVIAEVDRYIVWPGQALAYKIGQLKFKELRELAQKELASDFSVRAFHDQMLNQGALPMNYLEQLTKDWIQKQKKKSGTSRNSGAAAIAGPDSGLGLRPHSAKAPKSDADPAKSGESDGQ